MKTKRFDFNFKPLQLQISFAVEGSVPDTQNYSTDTQEYTPDYTLTPLIIQPNVSILDKDEVLPAGRVNHTLTNVKWYENINGISSLISLSDTNYEITSSGGYAGRIKVKRNAEPLVPITLEFYAEFIDARNNQVNIIRGSYQIKCSSASDSETIRIELDAASQTIYNPLSDSDTQVINATVWIADRICEASKYALVWEILGDDNIWHTAGSDDVLDYHISVSGNTATINRRLMGNEMFIRCRCKYSADSTPASVQLTDATPQTVSAIVRRIPKFEFDFTGVPVNIPAGLLYIAPTAIIRTTNGEISSAENELLPLWYIATNKASGSLSYSQVAQGSNPIIPTSKMDNSYGAVIGLDVLDRGYEGAFTDGNGAVFCDNDGKVLIIH